MKIKLTFFFFLTSITSCFIFAQTTFLDKIGIKHGLHLEVIASPDRSFLIANSFKENFNQNQYDGIQIIKYDECESIVYTKEITVPNH